MAVTLKRLKPKDLVLDDSLSNHFITVEEYIQNPINIFGKEYTSVNETILNTLSKNIFLCHLESHYGQE
jgi:hypothetical protein